MNIFKRRGFINVYISVTCGILSVFQEILVVYGTDNFALMTGSLRTFQVHACDGEVLRIKCPPHTVISINYAQYGRPSAAERCTSAGRTRSVSNRRRRTHPDGTTCVSQVALRVIESKCHEQVSCRMIASAETFLADPCPNERKYAEVAYKCRPAQFINVIACEGDKMNLSCEESMRILVISATFGSSKSPVMECPQVTKTSEECYSSYATERVVNMCVGKRSCSFDIDSQNLGAPKCSEFIRKHLKIAYTCVPVEVLKYSESKSDGSNANDLLTQTTNEIEVHTTSYPAWASNMDQRIPSYLLPAAAPSFPTDHNKIEMQSDHISTTESNVSDVSDRELVSFISEWIAAEHYITGNKSKLIVYVSVSLTVGVMLFIVVVLIHIFVLRKLGSQKTKEDALKEPPPIVEDDFFSDSDLDHFEDDPLNIMNSLTRKISETVPRAPVSDDPSTNHYFS